MTLPDLFGSEYAFDSTGFESTQALARYALDRTATGVAMQLPAPDSLRKQGAAEIAPVTRQQAKAFAELQMQANLFCRGVVEKAYYTYGSDYRGDGGDAYVLSYMAQMGGWAVMDHALHDGTVPDATVRLGYASYLSAWALMNTGDAASNYGYWYPGAQNDGGAGGGFEPAAMGHTWLGQPHHRGSWYYSSEEDLGFCGALRAGRTVIYDDPVFGRFCFGGSFTENAGTIVVSPQDGVRRRFSLRVEGQRFDVEVHGARFISEHSISWERSLQRCTLLLERDPRSSGEVRLHLEGMMANAYRIQMGEQVFVVPCAGKLDTVLTTPDLQLRVELSPV